MQQLMSMTQGKAMTSKELVEVINAIRKEEGNDVEIQHDKLMRRIRSFDQILAAADCGESDYVDSRGKTQPMLLLSKRASMLAVSSESPRVNLAIIDRWQELEATQAKLLPQTHIQAVEAYLVTLKQVEAQQAQLGIQAERISEDAVLTAKSDTYYPISHLKQWIPTASGKLLARMSEQLGYEVRTVYSHYDSQTPIQTYHKHVINTVYETDL